MSKYAILRVQKLKSPKSVRASMKHAYREQETPNADPKRTPANDLMGAQNVREGMAAFEAAMPDKIRKNAVQCVEYLVTASPGSFAGREAAQEAYLAEALRWIEKRHGKENVIASVIHRDEKTPHLCAYVVPKDPDTGRLNCRRFLGGAKALNEMQTDFARSVGQGAGLERGIEGSRATHTKLKTYYGALERDEPAPVQITPADLKPQILPYSRCQLCLMSADGGQRMAEAGASDSQIQAVTGHKTRQMVELYTAGARRKQMAKEAIGKLPVGRITNKTV